MHRRGHAPLSSSLSLSSISSGSSSFAVNAKTQTRLASAIAVTKRQHVTRVCVSRIGSRKRRSRKRTRHVRRMNETSEPAHPKTKKIYTIENSIFVTYTRILHRQWRPPFVYYRARLSRMTQFLMPKILLASILLVGKRDAAGCLMARAH